MCTIGKILCGVNSVQKQFLKKGVAATADVIAKKVNIGVTDLKAMLHSPAADQFIKSSCKQNARVISDNIVKVDGKGCHRVITKRLGSGTTVANAYDLSGNEAFKEVVFQGGFARSYSSGVRNEGLSNLSNRAIHVKDYQRGTAYYSQMYSAEVRELPVNAQINDGFIDIPTGITSLSNADNKYYQDLLRMGMVWSS